MVIFHSYVSLPEGNCLAHIWSLCISSILQHLISSNAGSWGVLTSALCISSIQGYFPCFFVDPPIRSSGGYLTARFFHAFRMRAATGLVPCVTHLPWGFFWKCPSGRAFDQFKTMSVWKNRCGFALESGVHGISKNGNCNETWTTNRWSRGFPIPNNPLVFPVF
jgi:hypothetical protein